MRIFNNREISKGSGIMNKKWVLILLLVLLVSVGGTSMARSLSPCPDKPNCVSSLATKVEQQIAPLKYTGNMERAKKHLLSVIHGFPRTEIIANEESYLHVTFTSFIFRFTDDVEFLFDADAKLIQLRSASRVGHSDLGANRKRVAQIRQRFYDSKR